MIDDLDLDKDDAETVHEVVENAPPMDKAVALVGAALETSEETDMGLEEALDDPEFIEFTVRAGAKIMYEQALEHEYYLNAFRHFDPDNQDEWSENQIQSLRSVNERAAEALSLVCFSKRQGATAEMAAYIALEEEVGLDEPEAEA